MMDIDSARQAFEQMPAWLSMALAILSSSTVTAAMSWVVNVVRERRRERAIEERIRNLEIDNKVCQEANAQLREDIGGYRELNVYLRKQVDKLQERLERLERGGIDL